MLNEFKQFISRGNALDMAVGIIMGAAFTAIVTSLVNDVIMPPIGVVTGGVDFKDLFVALKPGVAAVHSLAEAKAAGIPTLNYGVFLNAIISFLIVAFVVFMLVKGVNRMTKKKEEATAASPPPPREVVLLEEIRDLLKQR